MTCHGHIAHHHFEEYERQCNAVTPVIQVNFQCVPDDMKKMRQEKAKGKQQTILNFPAVNGPKEFTREVIVEAVAKHIGCDDQVRFSSLV